VNSDERTITMFSEMENSGTEIQKHTKHMHMCICRIAPFCFRFLFSEKKPTVQNLFSQWLGSHVNKSKSKNAVLVATLVVA